MIVNIPSADSLNEIALRLYVSAWSAIANIYDDFGRHYDSGTAWSPDWPGDLWGQEWSDYIEVCQPDMQSICIIIQQSNELALKARICSVSPYLLLIRSEARFSQTVKNVDFGTLRTLDALELPGAVNTLCQDTLSPQFIQSYDRIRSLRNQIAHLGVTRKTFQPLELLQLLVQQYLQLWPGRLWLKDRLEFTSDSRRGFFHDGSNTSASAEVMQELPFTFGMLRPAEFKQLFGIPKKTKLHICPRCYDNVSVDYADLDSMRCETAYLTSDKTKLECLMCDSRHSVITRKYYSDSCRGRLIIRSEEMRYDGVCACCGAKQPGFLLFGWSKGPET